MDIGAGRMRALLTGALLATVVGLAGCADPAEPLGVNRPALAPLPLAGRCWPLPGVDRFGFDYQVRSDQFTEGDLPTRRRVVTVQYDLASGDEVVADLRDKLDAGGFSTSDVPPGAPTDDGWTWVHRSGYGAVGYRAEDLDVPADNVVRGDLVLDLPATSYDRDEGNPCPRPLPAVLADEDAS